MSDACYIPSDSLLTFIKFTDKVSGYNKYAIYKCICGNEKEIRVSHAKSGRIKSCGCLDIKRVISQEGKLSISKARTTHGLRKHPLYSVYADIIKRCENKNSNNYAFYGARGVTICDEWRHNFKAFYDWAMANGWRPGLQIDKDIKTKELGIKALIYSPEMCSIVTRRENMNSIRSNRIIEFLGRKQTMSQWADEFNIDRRLLWERLNRGLSIKESLSSNR
jgi:hypothetical protein